MNHITQSCRIHLFIYIFCVRYIFYVFKKEWKFIIIEEFFLFQFDIFLFVKFILIGSVKSFTIRVFFKDCNESYNPKLWNTFIYIYIFVIYIFYVFKSENFYNWNKSFIFSIWYFLFDKFIPIWSFKKDYYFSSIEFLKFWWLIY